MLDDYELDETDFVDLLSSTPATREEIQSFITIGYGIPVPSYSYQAIWNRLARDLGDGQAAEAVAEIAIATAKPRLLQLLQDANDEAGVFIRSNEPKIVELLFDYDGFTTELGRFVVDYSRRRVRRPEPASADESSPTVRRGAPPTGVTRKRFELPTHVRLQDVRAIETQMAPESARPGAGWRLERVQASSATHLKVGEGFSEADFEEHLVQNWARIDFGFGEALHLVGRQVRLKDTREKVDLVARSAQGKWVLLELKIEPATGGDFTQLQSYLADMEFQGIPRGDTHGILIAPAFAERVLNAAARDPQVTLLRFLVS